MKNSEKVNINNDEEIINFANNDVDNSVQEFKIKHFIAQSNITPYHRLKQLLVELKIRQDSHLHIMWEIERKNMEMLVEQKKAKESRNEFEKKYIEIDILNIIKDKKRHEDSLVSAEKEKNRILKLIKEILNGPEGTLPNGTKLIDVFGNEELENEMEKQHWIARLAKQAAMEMLAYGKIGTGNMDAIAMMAPEEIAETLALATDYTVRVGTGMSLLTDKSINDLKLGYLNPKTKEQLGYIGISREFLSENLLQNDIDKNNTLINSKYNDIKDNTNG